MYSIIVKLRNKSAKNCRYLLHFATYFLASLSVSCDSSSESHLGNQSPNAESRKIADHANHNNEDQSRRSFSQHLASRDPSRAQLLHRLTIEWDGLPKEFSGEELLKKQKEFSLRAVGELGAGPELLEFLGDNRDLSG